jgi:hypothetical protein
MKQERRVDVTFVGEEVRLYKVLEERARGNNSFVQDEIKKLIK